MVWKDTISVSFQTPLDFTARGKRKKEKNTSLTTANVLERRA